jgi:hypothetical protein
MKAKEIEKKIQKIADKIVAEYRPEISFFSVLTRGGNRTKTAIWIFSSSKKPTIQC